MTQQQGGMTETGTPTKSGSAGFLFCTSAETWLMMALCCATRASCASSSALSRACGHKHQASAQAARAAAAETYWGLSRLQQGRMCTVFACLVRGQDVELGVCISQLHCARVDGSLQHAQKQQQQVQQAVGCREGSRAARAPTCSMLTSAEDQASREASGVSFCAATHRDALQHRRGRMKLLQPN